MVAVCVRVCVCAFVHDLCVIELRICRMMLMRLMNDLLAVVGTQKTVRCYMAVCTRNYMSNLFI